MKKLMIAACAMAFGLVAQAASVEWYIGELKGPGANGGWSGSTIEGQGYLATLLVSDTYTGTSTSGYSLGTPVEFTSGDTASEIDGGWLYNTAYGLADGDKTWYGQIIVTKGDYTLTSQVVSFEATAIAGGATVYFGPDNVDGISALPGMQLDATYGAFSASGWQSVPEPTSGLLLLLGVAGLALRRRRA